MEQNQKILFIYPLPPLLTSLRFIPFTTEDINGCTTEAAKGANNSEMYQPSCFFISCSTVSVIPSINTFKSSNDFMNLIISFISSLEIIKSKSFSYSDSCFCSYFSFKFINRI